MKEYSDSYISPWGYIGYSILWAIPVLGWLIWLFNCFSRKTNKRNYARSIFCAAILGVIVWGVIFAIAFITGGLDMFLEIYQDAMGDAGMVI